MPDLRTENVARPLRSWIVLRYEVERMCWTEVGCADAGTAGDAFNTVVVKPNQRPALSMAGEYRVLPLTDGGHFAVEWNLRDLDAEEPTRAIA